MRLSILDYSRVEIDIDARRRGTKLWYFTASSSQQSRYVDISSPPRGEKYRLLNGLAESMICEMCMDDIMIYNPDRKKISHTSTFFMNRPG